MKIHFILAVILACSSAAEAQKYLGDYNGDGRSEIAVAQVNRGLGQTQFFVRERGGNQLLYTFNAAADAIVTGRYFVGNKKFYPGIVRVKSASQPLEWSIKNAAGQDVVFSFGLPGDTIPNQMDVDCDGVTDIITTRPGTGAFANFRYWYVARSTGGSVLETLFGLKTDSIAVADIDGDNCGELVALRPETYIWYTRKLTASESTTKAVQWGLPGDYPLLPQDLDGNEKADYVIVRPSGNRQVAYIRYSNTRTKTLRLGEDDDIPVIGRFFNRRDFAWHNRNAGKVTYRMPTGLFAKRSFGVATNIVIRPDGTVIQPDKSGRIGAGEEDNPNPPSNGGSCTTPEFPDGSGGALWKPEAEGGAYNGHPTFLGSNSIQSVEVLDSSGELVYNLRLRYYGGPGNRSVWDSSKSAEDLQAYAPLTVRANYNDGACEDRSVPNPEQRYD